MATLRIIELFVLLGQNSPAGYALLIPETFALWFGLKNVKSAKEVLSGLGGWSVTCAYLLGALLLPSVQLSGPSAVCLLLGFSLSAFSLFWLKDRFTIGCPAFVSLIDRGPYSIIRHPQATARLLVVLGVAFSTTNPRDLGACLLACALVVHVTITEEAFLSRVSEEYRAYKLKVRHRWVPGLV